MAARARNFPRLELSLFVGYATHRRAPSMGRIKDIDEIKAEVRAMAGKSKIFRRAKIADVESVLKNLTSKDPERWAAEWSRSLWRTSRTMSFI
jgi:hypothetical protein